MNDKRLRFVKEYLIDRTMTQAAIRAGYAAKSAYCQGSRLLKNAEVSRMLEEETDKINEKLALKAEYVIDGLREVAERCLQKKPVMEFDRVEKEMVQAKDDNGNDVWMFDSTGANRAFELLGKHLNLFAPDKELIPSVVNNTNILVLAGMTDEELEAELEKLDRIKKAITE